MITAGIDYGAGNTRCVVMKDGGIVGTGSVQTDFDLEKSAESSLEAAIQNAGFSRGDIERIGATGSGSFLGAKADILIEDAQAVALAVRSFLPNTRTVLDIGYERSLAARLERDGGVVDVAVSRECAAETGVYMESIGRLLEADPVEGGLKAVTSKEKIPFNAQCLIFAEREIPELLRGGFSPSDIFKSANEALALHIVSMVQRIGLVEEVALTGVVGRNSSLIEAVRSRIEVEKIYVPDLSDFAAAAGAASAAAENAYRAHRVECVEDKAFVVLRWPGSGTGIHGKGEAEPPDATKWLDPGVNLDAAPYITTGVDMGSVCSKACMMVDGSISSYVVMPRSGDREEVVEVFDLLLETAGVSKERVDYCVGTGYGCVRIPFADRTITDTACHARGAAFIYGPSVRTVLDVGGQEMKVMRCDGKGKVTDFLVNDKCAAGTGVGIEAFAGLLGVPVADVGGRSLQVDKEPSAFPDTCVVHAWSRAEEMLAKGVSVEEVLAAFCSCCAERINSLLEKAGVAPGVAFTGGVAKNRGIVERLALLLGYEPLKSAWDPQIAGAAGAALFGYKLCLKGKKRRKGGEP
jgi:predicted CoA-substrate-specific enzyme activase